MRASRADILDVEGFVLAGGASSRFGEDKALAEDRGAPLLTHALRALRELGFTPRVVCRDSEPYLHLAHAFVLSERKGLGPGEGLRAVLRSCAAPRALVLSTDMPGVAAGLLRHLLALSRDDEKRPVCFQDATGRRHPFPGLYPRSLLVSLAASDVGLSMQRVLDDAGARSIRAHELPGAYPLDEALCNVNRPEDLDRRPR